MSDDDPMGDVPEPDTRFAYRVPWGIIFLLALIPIAGLVVWALVS